MAGTEAAKEAVYLGNFLSELGLPPDSPITLGMDNSAAIDLSYNPEHHSRTKHIERRHYFIRECVENGRIRVPYVATADNMADFFTKPLPAKSFFRMRDIIMNVDPKVTGPQSSKDLDAVDQELAERLFDAKDKYEAAMIAQYTSA